MERKSSVLESMTAEDLRSQVVSCHVHMSRCLSVLKGERYVQPVALADVMDSVDMELFYTCKRIAAQLKDKK